MNKSHQLFMQAKQIIPGGVNSPVRAFHGVGGEPVFFNKGAGAYLFSEDGQRYIDYMGSWGPLILGHCNPQVITAIEAVLHTGISFGAPTALEIQLAEKIIQLMPNIEKIRMVNSGTEATMTAIRLARGYTQKNYIIKFNGCYHGHHDSLLVKAGSGNLTLGLPSSAGVPNVAVQHTLIAEYNDLAQVEALFQAHKEDIAAVIVEPVAGNMGMILPEASFLPGLRNLCDQYQTLLIFDEVMTGFRVALGGAQSVYSIKPDLTTLGKVIGGGMPVGAIGGSAEIMNYLAPVGPVYQAGTLSGNPLAMAAGLATLQQAEKPGFYEYLSALSSELIHGLQALALRYGVSLRGVTLGGMFGLYINAPQTVCNYHDMATSNVSLFKRFYHMMLKHGIYLAPSLFEAGFISAAHTKEDIADTLTAAEKTFQSISSVSTE